MNKIDGKKSALEKGSKLVKLFLLNGEYTRPAL